MSKIHQKRPSRKSELRRLAAKQGWHAGHSGAEADPPRKVVMARGGGIEYNPVPSEECAAYWDGYNEGREAALRGLSGNLNPYSRELRQEEQTGTFGAGYGIGRFHMKICTECNERKLVKGAHFIRGKGRHTTIVRFVCADCWGKVGADNTAPRAA